MEEIKRYQFEDLIELEKDGNYIYGPYVLHTDHEAAMQEKEATLSEQDETILHLQAALADALKKLEEAKGEIAERDRDITTLKKWVEDPDGTIADLRAKLAEAIRLYDEYIAFINKENKMPFLMAHNHGWRCPEDVYRKGVEYRKQIEALKGADHAD